MFSRSVAVVLLKRSCHGIRPRLTSTPAQLLSGGTTAKSDLSGAHAKMGKKSILFAFYNAPMSRDMRYFSQVCAQRHNTLLRVKPVSMVAVPSRGVGMLVARAIRHVLKLRYIVLGGAIGGGMSLNKVIRFSILS